MDADDRARLAAWEAILPDATYYELLGILEIADEAAIRRAFRTFSRAFHPDAHPGTDAPTLVRLRRLFQRGTEAYRVLTDPEARAAYQLALAKGHKRLRVSSIDDGSPRARSLVELCRSPAARAHAREADRLISAGQLAAAHRELLLAVHAEPDTHKDPELQARLQALDLALHVHG